MRLVSFERVGGGPGRRGSPRLRSLHAEAALGFEGLESTRPGTRRLGAIVGQGPHTGWVVDLNRALAIKLAFEDVGAPEAEADSLVPCEMLGFLRHGESAFASAQAALDFAIDAMADYDAPDVLRAGAVTASDDVRVCAPVPHPGKIIAVVDNYATDAAPRPEPTLVLEAPNAVAGPRDPVPLPRSLREVDFGGGLGCVIGRRARCVDAAEALEYVAGYLPVLDLAAADAGRTALGRSFDSSLPCGPALVTADEIADPGELALRTVVSGEPFQVANTKEMRLPIGASLARASELVTLEPGDLLVTGSPVGATSRTPPRWLREGDVVEVEIEGLGRLCNDIVSAPTGSDL